MLCAMSADRSLNRLHWLETRIPPPVLMLGLGLATWSAASVVPSLSYELPYRAWIAALLALAGVALNLLPKLAFKRAATTVNPLRPASTTQLVTSGLYRFSRNPMYLGHALMLLGWALYLQHAIALIAVPLFNALRHALPDPAGRARARLRLPQGPCGFFPTRPTLAVSAIDARAPTGVAQRAL